MISHLNVEAPLELQIVTEYEIVHMLYGVESYTEKITFSCETFW